MNRESLFNMSDYIQKYKETIAGFNAGIFGTILWYTFDTGK